MYKKNTEHTLEITSLSSEGKGIAKPDEKFVVFVEQALPGDKVLVNITRKKSNYAEAKVIELISPSPWRINLIACTSEFAADASFRILIMKNKSSIKRIM